MKQIKTKLIYLSRKIANLKSQITHFFYIFYVTNIIDILECLNTVAFDINT